MNLNPNEADKSIVKVGDPLLRSRAREIADPAAAAAVARQLVDTLRLLKGAGLAAPQIGIPYRVFVVEVKKTLLFPDREESPLYTVINPQLEFLSQDELYEFEGCFSVPDYLGQVARAKVIQLSWTDSQGKKHKEKFEGYLARVFQHEMDHLNGVLYLDRMADMSSFTTRENFMRARLENQTSQL